MGLYGRAKPEPLSGVRVAALALAAMYGFWLIFFYRFHFVDYFNLALHEAGHPIFGIFGQTIGMLGGTLSQLAFPIAAIVVLKKQRGLFEAALAGVWLGGSLMYTAAYVSDADDLKLPLVGGGIHDFHWLLSRYGSVDSADGLGGFLHFVGAMIIVISLSFAATRLRPQSRRTDT